MEPRCQRAGQPAERQVCAGPAQRPPCCAPLLCSALLSFSLLSSPLFSSRAAVAAGPAPSPSHPRPRPRPRPVPSRGGARSVAAHLPRVAPHF